VREAFSIERISRELRDPRSLTLLSELGGTMIGYARLDEGEPEPPDRRAGIELVRMYVDSAHHGRGVADALMGRCIDEARSRGYGTMWLGVWEHHPRAQRFYARWGFERVGEHEFMLGDDRQTDWIMERAI
jgi:GNAT superfamily N-acetyltransferase